MLNFDEFVINLDSKTAILFLGQKYDNNKLIELLPKQYTIRKEGGQRKYCEMLDNFVSLCKAGKAKDEILHDIKIAETKIIDDRFAKLLRLPWNGIVTSLVHGAPGFNELIEVTQLSDVKKDYYSAQKRKITYLYGKAQKEDGIRIFPLSSEEKITSRNIKCRLWENILERIAMRGVLVVDSWDPAEDWLQASDFSLLIDAPKESVYFFNISEETQNNEIISCLIEKGIAVNVPSSLYDFCQYDDNEYSYDETEYDEASYCYFTISSQLDTRKRSVKKIEKNILYQLDPYIHVLDDSVLNSPNYYDRRRGFKRFLLSCASIPLWGGYLSDFYFCRDNDEMLYSKVKEQLDNNNPSRSKVILLEGRNSSGRTACLGKLAIRLRSEREYPVIFITSEMNLFDVIEQLRKFIPNQLNEKIGAKKTVIICDKNTYDNDDLYYNLRKSLEEYNVVVVGSKYLVESDNDSSKYSVSVHLSDELSDGELEALKKVVSSVDTVYQEHIDEIISKIKEISNNVIVRQKNFIKTYSDRGNWFLMIMYRLFEDLHDIQKKSVTSETQLSKQKFVDWLIEYDKEKMLRSSFGALYQNFGFPLYSCKEENSFVVTKIFNMIAVAGKYGIELPAMVIYRMYCSERGTDGANWEDIIQQIDKCSVIDMCTYEDGDWTVRFTRTMMANLFLASQVNISNFYDDELMELEINSLLDIIKNTNFSMDMCSEAVQVVNLIRKFGPNGPDAHKYRKYYMDVACAINEKNQFNNEALLVECHFIREAIEDINEENRTYLLEARNKLYNAINRYDSREKTTQLGRLEVELCSNILRSIGASNTFVKKDIDLLDEINKHIEHAMRIDLNRFSVGVFLDANLKTYKWLPNEKKIYVLSNLLEISDCVWDRDYSDFGSNIYDKLISVLELAKDDDQIALYKKRLLEKNSDVFIFKEAMTRLDGYSFFNEPHGEDNKNIVYAIRILKEYKNITLSNPRSLYLYIRLLWVKLFKNKIFAEKQFINISSKEWGCIKELCRVYLANDEAELKPLPCFVNMIAAFCAGNYNEYKHMIDVSNKLKKYMPLHITYAILCNDEHTFIREKIKIITSKNKNGTYEAKFINPLYENIKAYIRESNFKDVMNIGKQQTIDNVVIGFNFYGVVVYGESDIKGRGER